LAVDTADEIDRADLRQEINSVLAGLDELTRAAVVLKYYEDLSAKQIGELLELSPAAVDMRLSRGANGVAGEAIAFSRARERWNGTRRKRRR